MKQYAEIIPSQRLPKTLAGFDYSIPTDLISKIKIGQIVKIPWRHQIIQGMVLDLKNKAAVSLSKIRPIAGIENEEPLFTKEQLSLGRWLAEYYFVSLATVFKIIRPQFPKRPARLKKSPEEKSGQSSLGTTSQKIITGLQKKILSAESNKTLFVYQNEPDKNHLFVELTKALIKKGQVLIILPEIFDAKQLKSFFPKVLRENLVLIHSDLTNHEYWQAWQEIRIGKKKIIIGTKLALFAPFKNLKLVILDKEEDPSHKQADQNPRYQSREVAEELVKIFKAKLIISSPSPTAETYYRASKNEFYLITAPLVQEIVPEIIDMNEERKKGNFSLFSDKLLAAIKENLEKDKQIVLYLNRKGLATSFLCADCGFVAKCPHCQMPLVVHQDFKKNKAMELICHHCQLKISAPALCPKCQGPNLKAVGRGTERVIEEIKKLFGQVKIKRLENETVAANDDFSQAKIIVGTDLIFKKLDFSRVSLIGLISADNHFFRPDWLSSERTWQQIIKFTNLANQWQIPLIIQTLSPENPAIRDGIKNDYSNFYQTELKSREDFNYPPYGELIKLIYKDTDPLKARKESQRLYNSIKKLTAGISEPLPAFIPKTGRWFRWYLILKFSEAAAPRNHLQQIINKVPDNWLIDLHPISLL